MGQAWWCMPVIPASWEAEAEGSSLWGQFEIQNETLSQKTKYSMKDRQIDRTHRWSVAIALLKLNQGMTKYRLSR